MIGQPAPAADSLGYGDLLRIHAIPGDPANVGELAGAQITGPAFYLVRPDGYIGLAGTRLDAGVVKRYFAEHHVRGSAASGKPVGLALRTAA
jgi:hypothetical protein